MLREEFSKALESNENTFEFPDKIEVRQLGDGRGDHAGFMPVYVLLSTDGTVTFIEISKRPHELVEVLANIFNPTPIHIDPQL